MVAAADEKDDNTAEGDLRVDDADVEPDVLDDGDDADATEDHGALGDGSAADDDDAAPRPRRRWPAHLAAVVSLVYVCWYIVGLVVLEASPAGYNSMNRAYGNLFFRVVLCGVALALVFHAVDGLRTTALDLLPAMRRRRIVLDAAARFVLFAVWIPTATVILWPAVRWWFSR